ncbi:MAG: glycerophosphodiester phosphodiesterase family protein [Actinomycetota bacterium]|nr:glycerophosphodiester phosphodiesterase family protein [Actinomycetota bacterium]
MTRRRHRALRTVALVALAGCVAERAALPVDCPASPFRSDPPLVIAGGEGLGPANTILAMRRSMRAGADALEVDLRMSSDGVIVALHDRELSTTTDGRGPVDDHSWAELQRLDAAAHWSGDPIEEAVAIPSLVEILETFPDAPFSLEIKQTTPSMADELCEVLIETESFDRIYLSSDVDAALCAARDVCPESLVITTTYGDLDEQRAARDRGEPWCAASPIGQPPYREDRFDAEWFADAHAHGMAIFMWTVDDPEVLRELAEAGVDGVYTRRPDIARAVFDEFAADS